MDYTAYAIFSAIGFGFYNFFVGKTGGKISPFIATVFLAVTSAIVALVAITIQKSSGAKLELTPAGARFAILAGLAAGVAEIFYFFSFARNANVSVVLPLVFTLTVVTGVALGIVFNHESLTTPKLFGIALSLIGLLILSK